MSDLYCCIMAGGSGERFWPLSRRRTPKHLLKLFTEQTLVEQTVERVALAIPRERIFVLTNCAQLEATRDVLSGRLPEAQIVAEPAKRDTAPATALGTALVRALDPDAVVAFLPADALIKDGETFARQLGEASQLAAETGAIVTFGIKPTEPSTGFGYLELGAPRSLDGGTTHFRDVARFVEKPDLETAKEYVASGNYSWNAGMFLWKADTFLSEARRSQPELAGFIEAFPADRAAQSDFIADRFESLPKISVDYAIMEKAEAIVAAEAEFDWDDVGTWTAIPKHLGTDEQGNCVRGSAVTQDASGNLIFADKRLVVLHGVSDLIVVETDDALLICHRDQAQHIKKLQPNLPEEVC